MTDNTELRQSIIGLFQKTKEEKMNIIIKSVTSLLMDAFEAGFELGMEGGVLASKYAKGPNEDDTKNTQQ